MKAYLKIFAITGLIQLAGYLGGMLLIHRKPPDSTLGTVGLAIFLFSLLAALITGLVLAFRWGKSRKQKLAYVFLMPTNYVWVLVLLWVYVQIQKVLQIFVSIPGNCG